MAKRKPQKNNSLGITIVVIIGLIFLTFIGLPDLRFFDTLFTSESTPKITVASKSQTGDNPGPFEHGSADFTTEELKDSKKGWITYGKLDRLNRPTEANALIKPDMIGTGSSALQEIRPPGFISGLDPNNHSRGHLIGKQLGGSGEDEKNLVTLYQNPVNTPYMTKYENMIRQAVDNGETVRYRVAPIYERDIGMPAAILMEAKSINSDTIDFNVTIENKK